MREFAEFLNGLGAKVVNMKGFADIINESEIISGAVNDVGEVAGELNGFSDDSRNNNSNKSADKADDD